MCGFLKRCTPCLNSQPSPPLFVDTVVPIYEDILLTISVLAHAAANIAKICNSFQNRAAHLYRKSCCRSIRTPKAEADQDAFQASVIPVATRARAIPTGANTKRCNPAGK